MISAVINYEDKRVSIHTSKAKEVSDRFSPGFYEADTDSNGNLSISEEHVLELHQPYRSKETEYILETITAFFKEDVRKKVNSLGFIHKLGILLHGVQGTGKTSLMNYICDKMITHRKAIVFFCNTQSTLSAAVGLAKMIREIQSNPIIFIADEFERYAQKGEAEMKNLLDGKDSIENMLFIASTNYLGRVPETIKNRPSRFRVCQEILGITDKKIMVEILTNISNKISPSLMDEKQIEEKIKDISTCTIDDLKHIALDEVTKSFVKTLEKPKIGFKKQEVIEDEGITRLNLDSTIFFGQSSKGYVFTETDKANIKPSNI